ncbi:MAG: 2-oxoacid:acceptor oxidoreductase subunit alpha [Thermodesulfobacteriota bacterium]|nr:2-oxoacid:acceptor oxidoreductase subunit alpha [Thermodesulfobacteriota bacterium]
MPIQRKKIKSSLAPGWYFMQGDEACAEGAIAAGCRFYAGYPITPASEVMIRMVQRLADIDGVFIQMEDEIGSISSVIGASWAGAKAMTATSGPGISLMTEAVGYAVITETPCVIVDVQRAGPSTGQATRPAQGDIMQVKWGPHGDNEIVALAPWSVQEMYALTIKAFNYAERFRLPAFIMADEAVGHLRETLVVKEEVEVWDRYKAPGLPPFGTEERNGVPPMPSFGEGANLLVTGSTHDSWGFRKTADPAVQARLTERLVLKVRDFKDEVIETESYFLDDAEVGVLAYGFTARAALQAVKRLRNQGMKAGLLRLISIWPFADEAIIKLGKKCRVIFVPEMNRGQVAGELKKYTTTPIISLPKTNGEVIEPGEIVEGIRRNMA